jgi:hypothetical protein
MTGKRYYIATLGAWRTHAPRFANSHFITLDAPRSSRATPNNTGGERKRAASNARGELPSHAPGQTSDHALDHPPDRAPDDATLILVLVEADEGAHLALEDEPAFEALPHPLAQKVISPAAQAALAAHGVAPGATTFDAAEAVARIHPLLRHHVF